MATAFRSDDWIDRLQLTAHPEGGHFGESYRSAGVIPAVHLPKTFGGDRPYATSIYFLLRRGERSKLHRLASDEIWYHHAGAALEVVAIDAAGKLHVHRLGADDGAMPQVVIPAGSWFGARIAAGATEEGSLVGCAVAPGFDFADFELADRAALLARYPDHRHVIEELT